ncbi:MAG: DUF4097 family beta strand repeat-containing protein [Acidobacteriota bacterium]
MSNVNGSITAEAWDRNEIKLVAIKTADNKDRLNEVEIRIDSKADSFRVETKYDNWRKDGGDRWRDNGKLLVDYQLMVPRGAVLSDISTVNGSVTISNFTNVTKVSAVNGTIKASNLRGTSDLSTVNGEVVADFTTLDVGSKISLDTVNGKVNLMIPSDSNATIKADSLNGNITNDFGLPVRKGKYVGRDLYGRLGGGDVRIKLESVNGDLKVLRQNDGKSPSPSTNLLPQKEKDEEDWDNDADLGNIGIPSPRIPGVNSQREAAKIRVETQRALKDAAREVEMAQPQIQAAAAESMRQAAEVMKSEQVQNAIRAGVNAQAGVMARIADVAFFPSMPRVERKSDSFAVNGVPNVKVQSRGCEIKVTGWDKPEVKYSVTQLSSSRDKSPIDVKESHDASSVTLNVNSDDDVQRTRIEIFVPRKSNLNIKTDSEIRLDGVSGEIDLSGQDGAINVRDVDGKLAIASTDGRIRVIGFKGEITTETGDGSTLLEGDFTKVTAKADSGEIVITLPDNAGATVTSRSSGAKVEGLAAQLLKEIDENREYKIGSGKAPIKVSTDGDLVLRSSGSIADLL